MRVCLLVSRRCNLRCGFCRVEFTGQDMSWATARRAVARHLEWVPAGTAPVVKFFGGEPLLNWGVVRRLIEAGRGEWAGRGLRYELASNGSFLDSAKVRYLLTRPEVDVTVSQALPQAPLPGAWFTLVLTQGGGPEAVLARMRGLLAAGFRRFNFLPAYFAPWSAAELAALERSFAALARLIEGLWRRGEPVRVRNLEVWSPVPLFNDAVTVDTDGAVYASNLVQSEGMAHARPVLRLGSVWGPDFDPAAGRPRSGLLEELLETWAGPEAMESTRQADARLAAFVDRLRRAPGIPVEAAGCACGAAV